MRLAQGKIQQITGADTENIKQTLFDSGDYDYKITSMLFVSEDDAPVTINLWLEFGEERIYLVPKDSELTVEIYLEITSEYFLKPYEKIVATANTGNKINYIINGDRVQEE